MFCLKKKILWLTSENVKLFLVNSSKLCWVLRPFLRGIERMLKFPFPKYDIMIQKIFESFYIEMETLEIVEVCASKWTIWVKVGVNVLFQFLF